MKYRTIEFEDETLKLLDQRKLPGKIEYYEAENYEQVITAISEMVVRGAPAIGATGAYGVYLAALEFKELSSSELLAQVESAVKEINEARPTAVNLSWATEKMLKILRSSRYKDRKSLLRILEKEANNIAQQDIEANKELASYGVKVIPQNSNVLTHCNTGALATVDYGTALGVIREAEKKNKNIHVYATETRPRLQGAKLTAFELVEENISATLIADSTAGFLMKENKVDVVIVGADRIAANGDTANKIGTYMLSELARIHNIPFYIAAPRSTIDYKIQMGSAIAIEERGAEEIKMIGDEKIAPDKIDVYNPAFDVTPAENITGIITEVGVVDPPFSAGLMEIRDK